MAAPLPSGLTLRERRLLSLMVLTGKVDAAVARSVAGDFGARTESLADGSVVVVVSGRDNASELAQVSARCAIELRRALPDAPIVLATGRGDPTRDVSDDATETMADNSGASRSSSRYSGVFERAAGLLRHEDDHRGKPAEIPLPIVIDDTTAGLLGADFDVTRTRGSSAHALHGPSTMRARYTLLGKPTPFVGRARELASLLATWDDVCEQGVARAVAVVGEAGLGKSRLLYELGEALETHEKPSLRVRAKAEATHAGSPFAALGAALRRELGIGGEEQDPEERWHALAARIGSVVAEGEIHVAEFVAEVAGLRLANPSEQVAAARRDPRLMGERIRRAWRSWIKGEAARGPVLFVLEDLQWGDLPTVKLIEEMLHDLSQEPIFVLALARPEIDAAFPSIWSRVVERMPLNRLSKKAATTFVRSMLEPEREPNVVDRIVTLASGNALHLEELVRASAEGKTDAPDSLLALLSAQVEVLPDAERRVLRAASVFGSTFWLEGVCVLLGGAQTPNERVQAETHALVDALMQREMVSACADSSLEQERQFEFRNALVHDATYQMLTDDDRRLGHALAADWLERAPHADPFVLAQHRERGGELERAIADYTRSAASALDACDFGTVLDRIARAALCGASGALLAQLLVMKAEAHRWRGETSDCALSAKHAMETAAAQSDTYFRALRHYAFALSFAGNIDELLHITETLIDATPSEDALPAWVSAIGQMSHSLTVGGHPKESERLLERLERVPAERIASDVEMTDTLRMCRGLRAYGRGDFNTMANVHLASARAQNSVGDERGYLVHTANFAFAMMWCGHIDDAIAAFQTVCARAVEMKLVTLELGAAQNASFARLCAGDLDGAIQGSRDVLRRAEIEAPRLMTLAHLCLARALVRQDKLEEAEHEARAGIESPPSAVVRMYAFAVFADVLLALHRIDEAREASNEALSILRTLATLAVGDLFSLIVRAEVLEAADDVDGARRAIVEAWSMFQARRAFLMDDTARAMFDTQSPDVGRLKESYARIVTEATRA
jgi:tetratricopeptide (TPR) repeat protein